MSPLIHTEPTTPTRQRPAALLRVEDLSVSYGPQRVVTNVAFELGLDSTLAHGPQLHAQ